jgi:hypothetical protein
LYEQIIELVVEIISGKQPERVYAVFYSPGEGGVSSSSSRLEKPVAVGETIIYRQEIETVIGDKGDLYLLIIITDGTDEVLYNAGKLP